MDKKRYEDRTVEELKQELNLLDEMLTGLKQERTRSLEIKEAEFNDKHFEDYDNEKVIEEKDKMLELYKEELNEELGINEVRKTTDRIRKIINEKEEVKDTEPTV